MPNRSLAVTSGIAHGEVIVAQGDELVVQLRRARRRCACLKCSPKRERDSPRAISSTACTLKLAIALAKSKEISPARLAAFNILQQVETGAFSSVLLAAEEPQTSTRRQSVVSRACPWCASLAVTTGQDCRTLSRQRRSRVWIRQCASRCDSVSISFVF